MEDREEQSSGGGENILGELEDQVTCWVCFETPFTDPVTLGCGHSFCRECCLKMYKKNPLCGFCRREFGLPLAPTNQDLVELAKKFKRQQSGEPEEAPMETLNYDQESMWFYLPDEVVVDIFGNLEPADLGRTGLVCHHFHNLAEDSFLWRGLCKSHFPFVNVGNYDNDWKKCFVLRRNMQTGWESGRPGDFKVQVLRGHKDYISCFDYYRNNVVSGSADSTLQIWSTNKLKPIHELQGHLGVISAVQFNEIRIVSGATDGKVKIWDTTSGQTTHTLTQGGAVNALQFSETRIVSAGADRTLKVFDTRTGQAQQTLQGHQNGVTSLDYTGNRVISCDTASIRVWDVRTGACLKSLVGGQVNCFQPVGVKDLVAGENDGTVRIWDMATGTCTHAFAGNWQQRVTGLECDGEKIVVGCSDNSLKVFDYKAKRHLHDLRDHTAPINAVQFDGAKIVSASADNTLKVWDVKTGKRLYSLLGGSLQARSNNPPHPARPGASFLKFDEGRIVASFNSLLRVYSFTGESVEKKE